MSGSCTTLCHPKSVLKFAKTVLHANICFPDWKSALKSGGCLKDTMSGMDGGGRLLVPGRPRQRGGYDGRQRKQRIIFDLFSLVARNHAASIYWTTSYAITTSSSTNDAGNGGTARTRDLACSPRVLCWKSVRSFLCKAFFKGERAIFVNVGGFGTATHTVDLKRKFTSPTCRK